MRDNISSIQLKRAIAPVVGAADNVASVSQIIDRQGFDSLAFLIALGAIADVDATFTVLVEHGDNAALSDAAAVPDAELVSQSSNPATAPEVAAGFRFDSDNEVRKIGYLGSRRYVRLTLTPANNTGTWAHSAVAIMGNPEHAPVIQAAS